MENLTDTEKAKVKAAVNSLVDMQVFNLFVNGDDALNNYPEIKELYDMVANVLSREERIKIIQEFRKTEEYEEMRNRHLNDFIQG